jgi:uncharacterized DUF497 family protein
MKRLTWNEAAEPRYIALGLMRGKLVVLVYSKSGRDTRVISLKPATEKGAKIWLAK